MTKGSPVKPNFFILGAGKSGTTSLYVYLAQHPEIFMSFVKEPTFFCDCFQIVKNPADYLALFEGAGDRKRVGEASHAYLTCPRSAALLRAFTPDAKFVVTLRNPVDRAFSLYQHMTRMGDEWVGSFEEALAIEEARTLDSTFKFGNPQYFYNYLYFRSGLYSEQIERYYQWFERSRFLFVTFDELKSDALAVIGRVCEFLDVDPSFTPKIHVHNKGHGVRSPGWQFFLKHRLGPFLSRLYVPRGAAAVRRLMDWNCRGVALPSMDSGTRDALRSRYTEDIRKVEDLTGLDLSRWVQPRPAVPQANLIGKPNRDAA